MKNKNRIWTYPLIIMGFLLMLISSCKKDKNIDDWSEEDQAFYNNVIALQDKAGENYDTWSLTLDSLEVINRLQQFFLSDPSVSSATIGSQGIAVQYTNGMRGGIFLNPEDDPGDTLKMGHNPKMPPSNLNGKSLVNNKKAIFINPHYWERADCADPIIGTYNNYLQEVGFNLQTVYKNQEATVDRFAELSGYGIIHIYSHGYAWPIKQNITDVYLMTGEIANGNTTRKHWLDIISGNIPIFVDRTSALVKNNVYFISEKFTASHNDFSKDTVLFFGGFCFSFLGKWHEIERTFASGAYFGFNWRTATDWNKDLAINLIANLIYMETNVPVTTAEWMSGPDPPKSRWDNGDNRFCEIKYAGDPNLTLWKPTSPYHYESSYTFPTFTAIATDFGNDMMSADVDVSVSGVGEAKLRVSGGLIYVPKITGSPATYTFEIVVSNIKKLPACTCGGDDNCIVDAWSSIIPGTGLQTLDLSGNWEVPVTIDENNLGKTVKILLNFNTLCSGGGCYYYLNPLTSKTILIDE